MSKKVSDRRAAGSARRAARTTVARRGATVLSASIALLGLGGVSGFTVSAAAAPAAQTALVVRPCYLSGPQITVTSLRLINGRYLDFIQGSCFTSDAQVSLNTQVRDQRGEPVENLPESTVATVYGQFTQPLLSPTKPIVGTETVTAYDGGDGNRHSNPLSFDVPLPPYAPVIPL